MSKRIRKCILALLSIVLLFSSITVFAYDNTIPHDEKNVATWCQGKFSVSQSRRLAKGSGSTVGAAACSYFSMSYILVKGGYINPTEESPIDVIDRVEAYNGWDAGWGHMDGSQVSSLEPDLQCDSYMMGLSGYSNDEVMSLLKGMYDEGKYLQVCITANATSGHYIFIDGWDENGDMIIGDSGFAGTKWSDYYAGNDGRFKYVNVYSSKSGKKCNAQASIYSADVGKSSDTDTASTEKDVATYEKIKEEWELNGMPGKVKIKDVQIHVPLPVGIENIAEKKTLTTIRENIDTGKLTPARVFHTAVSFIGLCLILYAVLFILAYMLDYSNTFIAISLLSIISFGKFRVLEDEDESVCPGWDASTGLTFLNRSMVAKRVILLVLIGCLLISGVVSSVLIDLYFFIVEKFV